jgi:phosphomannomutase
LGKSLQNIQEYYRFCPGEERVKISDAICFGRRRSNFPKCKGCQFNDDERAARGRQEGVETEMTQAQVDDVKRERVEKVFRAYDVRARYPDPLDADIAWRIGHAAAQFLRSELRGYDRSEPEKATVVVGRDMRKHSPELTEAVIDGLRTGGSPVIDIGMIDTPQLYFAVNELTCCGGIQVTASHNPPNYNGLKICGQRGRPVGADTGLTKIYKIVMNTLRHPGGALSGLSQRDLSDPYKKFVLKFLKPPAGGYSPEHPLKVVVDASNGMAGRWFPIVFGDVDWLDIVPLNFDHNGEFVHDPNPLAAENLVQVIDRVNRSQANLGVCFDGDADRCIVVDNRGEPIPADFMTALLARQFVDRSPGSVVVYDLRSSRIVPEEIRAMGGTPRRERCGHVYLKKTMADTKAVFGGELSGHFYFRDNACCDSGLIAFAEIVNLLTASGKAMSELVSPLKRYYQSGEKSFYNEHPEEALRAVTDKYQDAQLDYLDGVSVQYDDWWCNVRASNTEPLVRLNIEAKNKDLVDAKEEEIAPLLGDPALPREGQLPARVHAE